MKSCNVPDFFRRALRQAIGVGLAVCIGYTLFEPLTGVSGRAATQWLQGCKWAAITIIVVSAPVLGKVTQVSFERMLGTIAGGLLGYVTVILGHKMIEASDVVFTGTMSSLVAGGAVVAGWAIGLDYSAKLFVMTFLLVIMGAEDVSDAFLVALTRISGILLGVLLSLALSVCIFPKSASHQATDNLEAALQGLIVLSQLAWNPGSDPDAPRYTGVDTQQDHKHANGGYTLLKGASGVDAHHLDPEQGDLPRIEPEDTASREAKCEKVMMDIYSNLGRCDEFILLSQSERFCTTINGRWCFLPFFPLLPGQPAFRLPKREMSDLAVSIRKTTRVLWAFRAALQEGFDDVMHMMERRYPAAMMLDLRMHSQGALKDAADGFREGELLQQHNLEAFLQAVRELILLSETQRRAIFQALASQQSSKAGAPLGSLPPTAAGSPPSKPLPGRPHASPRPQGLDTALPPELQVDTSKMDFFSPDSAGYSAKVRWHAFQFMMRQLGTELSSLHSNLALVLARMPQPAAAA